MRGESLGTRRPPTRAVSPASPARVYTRLMRTGMTAPPAPRLTQVLDSGHEGLARQPHHLRGGHRAGGAREQTHRGAGDQDRGAARPARVLRARVHGAGRLRHRAGAGLLPRRDGDPRSPGLPHGERGARAGGDGQRVPAPARHPPARGGHPGRAGPLSAGGAPPTAVAAGHWRPTILTPKNRLAPISASTISWGDSRSKSSLPKALRSLTNAW